MQLGVSVLCDGCGADPYHPVSAARTYVLAFLTSDDGVFSAPVFQSVRTVCEW